MVPLSPAFSVSPVWHAGALVPSTACSKMEMAEKTSSAAFLTMSLETCAELRFAVVLVALWSRAAFWPAAEERLAPPHQPPHSPGTGTRAGLPSGLCTRAGWVPAPLLVTLALCPHRTLQNLAPSPSSLEGRRGAPGALLLPARPARPFCQLVAVVRMGGGCVESKDRVLGGPGDPVPQREEKEDQVPASGTTNLRQQPPPRSTARTSPIPSAWACVYMPVDTLFKTHHHNCLSISCTTPSTFPLTPH